MFPYSYRKKISNTSLNLNFRNVSERVKSQYLNSYKAIVEFVIENRYDVPHSYSSRDWKKVMIELQCAAYMKLRKSISSGSIPANQIDDATLNYLKYDTITEKARVDWHDLYIRSSQSN